MVNDYKEDYESMSFRIFNKRKIVEFYEGRAARYKAAHFSPNMIERAKAEAAKARAELERLEAQADKARPKFETRRVKVE